MKSPYGSTDIKKGANKMSVLIKGMEMPKSCFDCHLFKNDECILIDYEDKDICDYGDMDLSQTGICPIIGEIPEKHGRLISAKRIEFELCESNMPKQYRDFCRRVLNDENLTPTVIESER